MNQLQQDVLCALLRRLLEQDLITQEIYDKSRVKILATWDWPEFFCHADDGGKEKSHGSA